MIIIINVIEYYNYLTTPSGKDFNLKELRNREYLILLKFLNGNNYKGFFCALDELISYSIPEFSLLDLCDKAYIYIAYYFYSVRSSISIKSEKIDSIEVPLTIMLDSIENNYNNNITKSKIKNYDIELHYPKYLMFDDNETLLVDEISSIRSIAGNKISNKEECDKLRQAMPLKIINEIQHLLQKTYSADIKISEAAVGVDAIKENILSSNIFYSIAYIYKDMIENFYNMQYLITHYIRVSWESLLEMTPIETTILYKNFIDDKKQQNERSKNKNSIGVADPNIADALGQF